MRILLSLSITASFFAHARADEPTATAVQPPAALKKLSLEELFEMEVTTVSRKPEKLSEAAAAIHVVTDEDIRRSGALSLPEALRDIPGVEVARVDSHQYAITARGFNGTVANKLLVLMDGRSVYTPLFSGVFWDAQDTFMEDIARIEVIRGPGATVWGANAVNGIINVLTKSAEETQGLLLSGGGGNEEAEFGGLRYGGRLGSGTFYRVYGKYFNRDDAALPNGADAGDRFQMGQSGFRIDSKSSTGSAFTAQGDVYDGSERQPSASDNHIRGGNILGRWTRAFSADSDVRLQAYYDRTDRDLPAVFGEKLDTYDLDFQHRFSPGRRQDFVWGLGYRLTRDDVQNTPALAFLPTPLTQELVTGFLQDGFAVIEKRLHLTFGSKIEDNDYTGFEYQPSGRLTWTPSAASTLWAVVSRSVRTPSRIDRDFFVPGKPPFTFLAGGRNFDSEVLHALEVGYKFEPSARLTGSMATFYDAYDRLRSLETGPPPVLSNGLEGRSYGLEVEAAYQIRDGWRVNGGYSFLDLQLRNRPGSTDTSQLRQEGDSPRHQFFARSLMDLPHGLRLDATLRYVDALPNQMVPAYKTADLRLGWKVTRDVELAIAGQNLLDRRHPEFGTPATRREIERGVYGSVRCQF